MVNAIHALPSTARDDLLVALALQFQLQLDELGPDGARIIRRFEARAGLSDETASEHVASQVRGYFMRNPPPASATIALRKLQQDLLRFGHEMRAAAIRSLFAQTRPATPLREPIQKLV